MAGADLTLAACGRLGLGRLDLAVDLAVPFGSVHAVLGPNGAGKSTLIRCLAGLLALDEGRIALAGVTLDEPATRTFVAPEHRRIGLLLQDPLLLPHLSVLDNVAFGPRSRGAGRPAAAATARAWLERVGLGDRAGDRPRSLSGGQAQRVGLARALAAEPDLLLLDEPMAALDAGTRVAVRRDLRRHLEGFGGATVLVTHDPVDALVLADEVTILEEGSVTQTGTIATVTARPRSRYVADLIGTNLLRGAGHDHEVRFDDAVVVVADRVDGETLLTIPPSAVSLHRSRPEGSARNRWELHVTAIELVGERARVALTGPLELVAEVTPAGLAALGVVEGGAVWASVKATEVTAYPA